MGKLSNWLRDFCDGDTRLYDMFQKSIIRSNYHEDFAKLTRTSIQGQLREWSKANQWVGKECALPCAYEVDKCWYNEDAKCVAHASDCCDGNLEIDHNPPLNQLRDEVLVDFIGFGFYGIQLRPDIPINPKVKGKKPQKGKLEAYKDMWLQNHWEKYIVRPKDGEGLIWMCKKHHVEKTRQEDNRYRPDYDVRIAEYLLYRTTHWDFRKSENPNEDIHTGGDDFHEIVFSGADVIADKVSAMNLSVRQYKFSTLLNPTQKVLNNLSEEFQERYGVRYIAEE